jgi:hypothetical protein
VEQALEVALENELDKLPAATLEAKVEICFLT